MSTNAADIIARRLYEAGCRHAFGIPGGEVLTIVRALGDVGIEFLLAKHENSAGFMAEGAHHHTGSPGVLVATLGPGVANSVNVIANAWQDRVPLIFLTGCVDAAEAAVYTHQVFDHTALLAPVTKASLGVVDGAVDVIIDKAIAIALDGQPGPVHVDVPISTAAAEQPDDPPVRRPAPAPSAPAPGQHLDTARKWLADSRCPLMIAGVDVLNQGAESSVKRFLEDYSIPLVTTYKAKGVLPEDHPLSLGGAGLSPKADEHLLPLLGQADLILLAGYDPIEMRAGWCSPWTPDARVVEFSAVPNTHYVHQASVSFVGSVAAGLEALRNGAGRSETWPSGEAAAARAGLRAAFSAGNEWGPAALIDIARRRLPRATVATVDSGAHRILLSQMWECYTSRTLLQSTAHCTMGCALPLAIGYKLAAPELPVVAFVGDACLEMVLGELITLRDLGLPVIVVVFVDESLALIEMKQRRMGFENSGVDFQGTDYPAIMVALGMHGVWVDDQASMEQAIDQALQSDRSTLLACRIGRHGYDGAF